MTHMSKDLKAGWKDLKAGSKASDIIGGRFWDSSRQSQRDFTMYLHIFENWGPGTLKDEGMLQQEGCGRENLPGTVSWLCICP